MAATAEQITRQPPALRGAGPAAGAQIRRSLEKVHLPFAVGLYLAAVVLPIGFNVGPLYMNGVRLLLIVLIVPMMLRLLIGAYGRILLPDVMFILHFCWITLSLAIMSPNQVVANAGSTGIEFLGGYVLGRACIRDRADFVALIRALGFICLCLMPFALYESLTGQALLLRILNSLPGIHSLNDVTNDQRMGLYRSQTSFAHPIHSGLFFILTFSLCFIGLKLAYGTTRRWTVAIASALGCFLALSSGAFLALVLQLGLITWAMIFRNHKARWRYLLGLFAAFYVLVSLLSNRSPIMVFLSYATFSSQTAYWRTIIFDYGMQNVWANPWFGLGMNGDWVRPVWMYSGSVDNFWLLTAMRYGIPGFLFLAAGYAWTLWKVGTRDFDADEDLWNLRRAWMFSFLGLTFTLCTVHIWGSVYSFVFFMFGSGVWFLYAQPEVAGDPKAEAEATDTPRRLHYTRFPQIRQRRL